ncbi:MAG: histidine phosphatase family protein [Bacteroidota bacterium]
MRRLILVRHAKSSWDYFGVNDHDRPLKETGINKAYLVSEYFSDKVEGVDKIFSSSANRALHTALIFADNLGVSFDKVAIENSLYEMYRGEFYEFIRGVDNSYYTIMLVFHNPLINLLARELGGMDIENVPTSALIDIKFDVAGWADIEEGGDVLNYISPKMILNKNID